MTREREQRLRDAELRRLAAALGQIDRSVRRYHQLRQGRLPWPRFEPPPLRREAGSS